MKELMVSLKTVAPENLHDFFLEIKKFCKENVVAISDESIAFSPVVNAYVLVTDPDILSNATSTGYGIDTGMWIAKNVMRFEYAYNSTHHLLAMFNLPEVLRGLFYCTVTFDDLNPKAETLRDLYGLAVYEKLHTKHSWSDDFIGLAQCKYNHAYPTKEDIVKNRSTICNLLAYEDLRNLIDGMNTVDQKMCFCPITAQEASSLGHQGKNAISVIVDKGIRMIEKSIKEKEGKKQC